MIRDIGSKETIEDVDAAVRSEDRAVTGRPWVMLNMVTSVDGATAVEGGSTPLSDDDDRTLFRALRGVADVILVGSATVMAEDYRPDRRLVIVSGRLNLDPDRRVFADSEQPPTVIGSTGAEPDRVRRLEQVAKVILLDDLSGSNVADRLPTGAIVLCEGGPTLNASLFADDVVDEINWTVSPQVVAGRSKRMAAGDALSPPVHFRLDRSWIGDESLFLRYVRG